jgi:hypothetical protein
VPLPVLPPEELPLRFYAAGQLFIFNSDSPPTSNTPFVPHVWVSRDEGATWHESSAQLDVGTVTAGGDGVVVFSRSAAFPSQGSSVWTSVDGLTWREVRQAAGVFASADVTSVARGPQGLVAGGRTLISGEQRAGIWTSPDGLIWTHVPNDDGIFGNGSDGSYVDLVVAGPRGILAIGQRSVDHEQIAWASPNGVHWKEAVTPFMDPADYYGHVVAWQGGFVEFNVDPFAGTDVWSSADGLTWTRVGSDELFGGTARVQSAVSFQSGMVAVGGFAPRPEPACLRGASPTMDLQTFHPTAFVWSPTAAGSATPPHVDPADPRTLGLRPSDIGGDSTTSSMSGTYVNLCALNPALGQHLAYEQEFYDPDGEATGGIFFAGKALSIVAQSTVRAKSGFRHLNGFFDEAEASIKRQREVPSRTRIGDESRYFRLQAVTEGEVSGIPFTRYAVAWRKGRSIGVIVTGAEQESVMLARRQLAHLEHP